MAGQPVSLGRVVQYRLPQRFADDERWRPADVVNAFSGNPQNLANLSVKLDPVNDRDLVTVEGLLNLGCLLTMTGSYPAFAHVYSAHEGTAPGCWRWPPRVEPEGAAQ